jgi:hypothetical protein
MFSLSDPIGSNPKKTQHIDRSRAPGDVDHLSPSVFRSLVSWPPGRLAMLDHRRGLCLSGMAHATVSNARHANACPHVTGAPGQTLSVLVCPLIQLMSSIDTLSVRFLYRGLLPCHAICCRGIDFRCFSAATLVSVRLVFSASF